MKIAVETLNRYLKKKRTTDEIVRLIGNTEIEVEEVLEAPSLDPKIILVKITNVEPHPNADRLRIVTITTGKKQYRVVCGAPNVAVEQRVAWVQPGAVLPDGSVIKKAIIRSIESPGMLASGAELGLSDDHSGIVVFEQDTHRLGVSLCDIVFSGDVLDIKTPANRWDYLSGVGVARELASYDADGQKLVEPEIGEYTYKNIDSINVKAREVNPRFVSAMMQVNNDVKIPAWIVDNLEANGYVSHNPIVDITNFVMLETGQPSHAYDADKIAAPLTVRFAKKGEKLTTLDDIERTLSIEDLVVCDAAGPIGLAGVMGSAHTQITASTKRIVLEAAQFDKSVVRKMAIRHGLRTEASARFERGLPLPLSRFAFARLLDLINQYCEGQIIDGPFDQLYGWPWQQFLGVRLKEAEKVLGVKIDESEVVKGLRRMGFGVEHFSLAQEVKKHLGKPYTWGANFRQHGETTFDCSYLIDRIYSKLGVNVGHTALGQYFHGKEVAIENLKPGDVLFTERNSDRPVSNHYYTTLLDGSKEKHTIKNPPLVGHNGIYIGNNKIVHAGSHYEKKRNRWEKTGREEVCIIPLEVYLENPGFIGARRYLDSFNHILAIEVPWWRSDIRREVDIIEEIAKIIGYDNLSPTLPDIPPMPKSSQSELLDIMAMRDRLVDIGGIEIATYSFISAQDVALSGSDNKRLLRISNPRSPEQAYLRSTLMASHLHMFAANRQAKSDAVCFEMSRVFERQTGKSQPKERWVLGISSVGPKALENVQAFLHRMLERYHSSVIIKNQTNDERFIAQRSAEMIHDNKKIGVIGQVRSSIAEAFDLQQSASYCEIELSRFLHSRIVPQLKSIPEHQLITRDISLEVKQNCSWADIKQLLENNPSIFSYQFKDYYRDDDLYKQDSHVYTWSIRLDLGPRPTTAIIEAAIEKLIKLLLSSLPAGSNPKIR